MKKIHIWSLLVLLLAACRKNELNSISSGVPVFMCNATIGSETINYQAGVNNMYMYTSHFKDSQNLWTLKGAFGKDSCIGCDPYLSFEVKDQETTNGSTLANGYAALFSKLEFTSYSLDSILLNTPVEIFSFFSDPNNPSGTTYRWNFDDGDSSFLDNPTHIFPSQGNRAVQLISNFNGYKDTITNNIDATYNSTCRVQFAAQVDTANILTVTAPPNYTSYSWNYGDGSTSNTMTASHQYAVMPNIYKIILNATSGACGSTNISYQKKVAVFQQSNNYCLSNFSYTTSLSNLVSFQPRINKSSFIVTYKNNGKTYLSYKSSKSVNQSTVPIFTLMGISLYVPNEKNESTLKITGKVDTYLYNVDNLQDSVKMKTDKLVFAVSFPK